MEEDYNTIKALTKDESGVIFSLDDLVKCGKQFLYILCIHLLMFFRWQLSNCCKTKACQKIEVVLDLNLFVISKPRYFKQYPLSLLLKN